MRATHRNQQRPPHRLGTFVAIAVALVLGISAAGVAVFGLAATATVAYLSEDLPDPSELESLTFAQPTILYDREGEVELGRFQTVERRVIAYDDVPRLVLDATTTAEDRTFWENAGFDAQAILSAIAENASGESERGASTITQQLVRARMLPAEVVAPGSDRYVRKAKEILQSMRLSETYPGVAGKERVITAYLNEIYYGHKAYGIAAAAKAYFGVEDLASLTPAQAALLAALPKSPSTLDPYAYAEENKDGDLVVPADSPPVVRRDWVLTNLPTSRWTKLTPAELRAALEEPVVLAGDQPARFRAGHFTWQVERQLQQIVGDDIDLTTAGYRVTTTLDWRAQRLAQRWVTAAVIAPNLKRSSRRADAEAARDPERRARLDPGAAREGRPQCRARRDRLPDGRRARLPGERRVRARRPGLEAVRTEIRRGGRRLPAAGLGVEADPLRGRVRVKGDHPRVPAARRHDPVQRRTSGGRRATPTAATAARSWSAKRSSSRSTSRPSGPWNGSAARPSPSVRRRSGSRSRAAQKAYLQAGLAGALGTVEVRPLDLTSAYGTFANGGVHVPPRMILEVRGPDGSVVWKAPKPKGKKAVSGQTAFLMNDILAGNSDPRINAALGPRPARHAGRVATGVRWRPRPARRRTLATSRRTATSPRRRTRTSPGSSSASGWATATTRCLARATRLPRSRPPLRCGTRSSRNTRRSGRSPSSRARARS